ncbi:hypothetical protein ABIB57_004361 [Devosia sp. UYZn731]
MRSKLLTSTAALVLLLSAAPAWAQSAEGITTFLDNEINGLSVLSRADQETEMKWFQDAAKPFAGMEIKVVSETITAHTYESKVLAAAFEAITGIKVTHDLIGEGDVVESCRPRCNRAKISMTPMSTIATLSVLIGATSRPAT